MGPALLSGIDLSQPSLEQEPVVQDGNIVHWPGFEALLHYALYQQVSVTFVIPTGAPACRDTAAYQNRVCL